MLFNSLEFLLFYVIVTIVYFLLRPKFRWIMLLFASYSFYMHWRYEYIVLIIFSTIIDYFCGLRMSSLNRKSERLPYLLLSCSSNIGLLFIFKYLDFFTLSINDLFGVSLPLANLILPMGISFYTFQTLSYSIDLYKGKLKAEPHLGKFALYVSFFPQLVAGPIERAGRLIPQLKKNDNKLTYDNFISGSTQMFFGFFKKVVIADNISLYVESIYGAYELHTGFTLLFATYLFAIQIYCDFSGYSDIAIGCAKILGYDLIENFKQPYFAKSVTEFWRRWHISLSTWLRDYLYIPLGGNRKKTLFTYRNLMLTMLIGGLWHGAAWNFVIWGFLNGLYLSIEKKINYHDFIEKQSKLVKCSSSIITFHLICLTWVFFRAETFKQAIVIIDRIFTIEYFFNLRIIDTSIFATIVLSTCILLCLEIFVVKNQDIKNVSLRLNTYVLMLLKVSLFFLILLLGISDGSQFIYFQF